MDLTDVSSTLRVVVTRAHQGPPEQGPPLPGDSGALASGAWMLAHLPGSNAGSTANWCCASIFSSVKWGYSDTELIMCLLWRWSELLWIKFLGQSTSWVCVES